MKNGPQVTNDTIIVDIFMHAACVYSNQNCRTWVLELDSIGAHFYNANSFNTINALTIFV